MTSPYGHYHRHNTTTAEHMAALWKEVAREHAARSSSARQYARDCHDSMDAAIRRANRAEFDAATYLADRDAAEEERDEAVQERDELRQTRRRLLGKVDQLEVKLRNSGRSAEQPRALTPDAITDDIVQRAWLAFWDAPGGINDMHSMRLALTAALTEPEPRPEGEPMTTDAFTEAARAEAERRNPSSAPNGLTRASNAISRRDFRDGAEWARAHLAAQEPTDAEVLAALNADYAIRFGPRNFPADSLEPYGDEAVQIMRAALMAAREARHATDE